MATDDFVGLVAGNLGKRVVDREDARLGVGDVDTLDGVIKNTLEQKQVFFRAFPGGDFRSELLPCFLSGDSCLAELLLKKINIDLRRFPFVRVAGEIRSASD